MSYDDDNSMSSETGNKEEESLVEMKLVLVFACSRRGRVFSSNANHIIMTYLRKFPRGVIIYSLSAPLFMRS